MALAWDAHTVVADLKSTRCSGREALTDTLFFERKRESMLLTGKRFQLRERTLAIEVVEGKRIAIILQAGAIIKVLSGNDQKVDVLWDSQKVEVFTCDVEMRGTEVKEHSAVV